MIRRWAGLTLLLGVLAWAGAGCGETAGAVRIVPPTVDPPVPPATSAPADVPIPVAARPTRGPLWAESPAPRRPTATRPAPPSVAAPPTSAPPPTARPATTRQPPAPTATPQPTHTPVPTRTPKPTRTPTDTRTPKPTRTPTDTRTPAPTRTSHPPTAGPTLLPPTATVLPLPPALEESPAAGPEITATPAGGGGEPTPHGPHRFVVSVKAKKYYYCDSDSAWHSLAAANLEWFDTEAALLARYPALVLHAPCKD